MSMKNIHTDKQGRVSWSLAPLWLSPAVKKTVQEYVDIKGINRNQFIVDLILDKLPKIEGEIKFLKERNKL